MWEKTETHVLCTESQLVKFKTTADSRLLNGPSHAGPKRHRDQGRERKPVGAMDVECNAWNEHERTSSKNFFFFFVFLKSDELLNLRTLKTLR